MKIRSSVWVGLVLFFCQSGFAEIREVKSFKEVAPYIDRSTLLVLDIDNTLIEPKSVAKSASEVDLEVGSDQWFYSLYDLFGKKPSEDPALDKRLMTIWNETQSG